MATTKTVKPTTVDAEQQPTPSATTTTYGSFNAYTGDITSPTLEYEITEYLGEYVFDFNVRGIVDEYVVAINEYLPEGVSLQGTEVVGPAPYDYHLNESIQNAFSAARDDLRGIIARHDKSNEPAVEPEAIALHDLMPQLGLSAQPIRNYKPSGEYLRHGPLMFPGGLKYTT